MDKDERNMSNNRQEKNKRQKEVECDICGSIGTWKLMRPDTSLFGVENVYAFLLCSHCGNTIIL